jgi:hypothetical protein
VRTGFPTTVLDVESAFIVEGPKELSQFGRDSQNICNRVASLGFKLKTLNL